MPDESRGTVWALTVVAEVEVIKAADVAADVDADETQGEDA